MPSSPITLVKGQNAPLTGGPVTVAVELAAAADLSALLVTAAGRVRSDADFIFFNQPDGPGVRCLAPDGAAGWRIEIDPDRLPAEIDQVRVVITLADPAQRFGQFPPPLARLSDAAGVPAVEFVITGLDSESIVIALEVYRRGPAWKVRAVGQGYAGGLAALITDHGVSVDEPEPAAAAYPPPPAPAAPPPPPPAAPAWVSPPPPAAPAPAWAPPPPPPAAPPSPPLPPGEVSLRKGGRVDLVKGQRVSLRKEDGSGLTLVRMGLGWDPLPGRASIDLDASAVLFAGTRQVDLVAFTQLRSRDGSIVHSGDNLTGEGAGDDEVISVDLTAVSPAVTSIVFTVTSFQGQTFDKIAVAYCRLVEAASGAELVRYTLAGGFRTAGVVMATLHRSAGGWKFAAVGEGIKARTPSKAATLLGPYLPTG